MEPQPNPDAGSELLPEGRQYLDMLLPIIDALYARGLYVFLDFHQDIAHDSYGGDGFPDWAIGVDDNHPFLKDVGFNCAVWATHYHKLTGIKPPGYRPDVAEGVRHTLRSFWTNSVTNILWNLHNYPVQDHLVGLIGQVARYFRALNTGTGHPAIIGYEGFNEPAQAGPEVRHFETTELPSYYAKVHREIRKYDPDAFVFVEPRVDWTTYDNLNSPPENLGITFTVAPKTALDVRRQGTGVSYAGATVADDRVVFSFHHYDPWVMAEHLGAFFVQSPLRDKEAEWPGTYDFMCNAAIDRGLIPFLSELGGNQRWTEAPNPPWNPDLDRNHFIRGYMELRGCQSMMGFVDDYWDHLITPHRVGTVGTRRTSPYKVRAIRSVSVTSLLDRTLSARREARHGSSSTSYAGWARSVFARGLLRTCLDRRRWCLCQRAHLGEHSS